MRLFVRGLGGLGGMATLSRPHIHFAFRARPFSILDDVKKNLENDEKLKVAREKIKMEQEAERELEEYHQFPSAFAGMLHYVKTVRLARRLYREDRRFLNLIQSPEFEKRLDRARKDKALVGDLLRRKAEIRAREMAERERKRVMEGKAQRLTNDEFEWAPPSWIESWRPPGYRTKEERDFAEFEKQRERENLEVLKKSALHKEFMSKLKEMEPEQRRQLEEAQEEALNAARLDMQQQKNPYANAPQSTALVVGPDKTGWEKFKDKFAVNLKSSTLFQKSLEFKEKLEESNNPLLVKTLDTVGAASDLGARVAKKVSGESETAAALRKLKEAWPHFDTASFWVKTVQSLPAAVRAFHERDYEWIKRFCSPAMYDVLCLKSDELCKSQLNPSGHFYPFIVLQPRTAEIITCVTDDPLRPYFMLKFSLQKTAEKVRKQSEEEQVVGGMVPQVPYDTAPMFRDVNWDKLRSMMKTEEKLGIPGQGMAPTVGKRKKGQRMFQKYGGSPEAFKEMLDQMKIVRADYILVLQFDPDRDAWLVHNFEQATLDLTF